MERVDMLFEPLRALLVEIGAFLPRLGVALLVLVGGWLLAKAVRFAVVRGLRAVNFNVLTERAGIDVFLEQGGVRTDTAGILGALVYWLVILAALVIAFNGLGLTYITDLLGRVVLYLPHVILAVLIVVFGTYFARFAGEAVVAYLRSSGAQDAELLGRIAQYAIVVFVMLIALDQLAIGGAIVRQTFLILLSGVVLALALAFGLGGARWAGALLERWWPIARKEYSDDDDRA
jgi:hypothetical protein